MRLFVSVQGFPDTFTKEVVDAYPGPVASPFLMVVEHGTLGRKAFGQHAPLAAGSILVAQCIEDLSQIDPTRAAGRRRFGQVWSDFRPFFVGDIGWISHRILFLLSS